MTSVQQFGRGPLRLRSFRLLFVGNLISNSGDWTLQVALPVYVFTETGSGFATSVVFIVDMGIGILLGPFAGGIVDRLDPRRIVVTTSLLQGLALLPLLAVSSEQIWPLYVVAAMQSALRSLNDPASFALVPQVVERQELVPANALASLGDSLARLIGSPLGGILVATSGLGVVAAFDALTFVLAAAAVALIKPAETHPEPVVGPTDTGRGVRAGLGVVRRRPDLGAFLGAEALAEIAFAMFPVLFVVFVVDELGGDGSTVGLIRGVAAFGGIAASVVVSRMVSPSTTPWMLMMWGLIGLGLVDLAFTNMVQLTTALWIFYLIFALSGLPNITSAIGANSTLQILSPTKILGRMAGLRSTVSATAALVGSLGAGLLVDRLGSIPLLNVQAGFYLAGGVATYVWIVRPYGRAMTEGAGSPSAG